MVENIYYGIDHKKDAVKVKHLIEVENNKVILRKGKKPIYIPFSNKYHKKVGRLYGYSEEDIKSFIKKISNNSQM